MRRRGRVGLTGLLAMLVARAVSGQSRGCPDEGRARERFALCRGQVERGDRGAQRACEEAMASCVRPNIAALLWAIHEGAGEHAQAAAALDRCVVQSGWAACEEARRGVCAQVFRGRPQLSLCTATMPRAGVVAPPDAPSGAQPIPSTPDAGPPPAPPLAGRVEHPVTNTTADRVLAGSNTVLRLPDATSTSSTARRTFGWVGAGVATGLAVLGAAAFLQVQSIYDQSQEPEEAARRCHVGETADPDLPGRCSDYRERATTWQSVGIGSMVGAGVLVGVSALLIWYRPREDRARVAVLPTFGAARAGLAVQGSF